MKPGLALAAQSTQAAAAQPGAATPSLSPVALPAPASPSPNALTRLPSGEHHAAGGRIQLLQGLEWAVECGTVTAPTPSGGSSIACAPSDGSRRRCWSPRTAPGLPATTRRQGAGRLDARDEGNRSCWPRRCRWLFAAPVVRRRGRAGYCTAGADRPAGLADLSVLFAYRRGLEAWTCGPWRRFIYGRG
jgi:hypothetical protein